MNLLTSLSFSLCFLSLASCTSITVQGGASVSQSYWFAPVQISLEPSDTLALVTSKGIGLVPSRNGAVLGYSKETAFLVTDPNSCRAIVILNDKNAVDSFTAFLKDQKINLNNICLSNFGEKNEKN